jgi:peptidoglycan hydrolase CwlO-like protein
MKVEFTSMRDLIKSLETDKKNLSTRVDELELLVDTLTNDKRELSATVSSQGSMIIQMKTQIETLQLDRDHWQKRAIEAEGKPKGKMNL